MSPGHSYGYGFSGPRMYAGMSQSVSVGDLEMFEGSSLVMSWKGLQDPYGVKNLIDHEMKA